MKLPVAFTSVLLLACIVFSVQPAQNALAQGSSVRSLKDVSDESETEKLQRIEACEAPDQDKPKGEIKRVSQLCGHALSLPKPSYPEEAKASRISGTVVVEIVTNQDGRVIWAKAISGPELLRSVSEKAACRAQYSPTLISGRAVQTESSIQYLFVQP
jgi:TonB family protein